MSRVNHSTASGSFATSERNALADLLDELGPNAPTLCDGWRTADLVAHLVVRENHPVAAAGIVLSPFAERTRAKMRQVQELYGYRELVQRFRSGPSARWVKGWLPAVDRGANTVEFFIHHEDVRRAQQDWQPRELPAASEAQLWRALQRAGRLLFRRSAVGVLLAWPDTATVRVRKGEPTAVVEGRPSEITLYAAGRREAAEVALRGPEAATEALGQTPLGF